MEPTLFSGQGRQNMRLLMKYAELCREVPRSQRTQSRDPSCPKAEKIKSSATRNPCKALKAGSLVCNWKCGNGRDQIQPQHSLWLCKSEVVGAVPGVSPLPSPGHSHLLSVPTQEAIKSQLRTGLKETTCTILGLENQDHPHFLISKTYSNVPHNSAPQLVP